MSSLTIEELCSSYSVRVRFLCMLGSFAIFIATGPDGLYGRVRSLCLSVKARLFSW